MTRHVDVGRSVEFEKHGDVMALSFSSPVLDVEALREFSARLRSLAAEDRRSPLVFHSRHPGVFLAGAHLAEIAELDAASCEPYAQLGRHAIDCLENHPAPTVAAVNGSCAGGGFDLVLACDAVIVGPSARFRHPGIRRGLITGWSGTTRLPSALGNTVGRAAVLEGRDVGALSLSAHGMVREVSGDPLETALEAARRLASLKPARWRLWRALRGPGFVDRFHASVVHKL